MKRTLGLLAVLASLSTFGQQSVQSFSLKEAQEYALKNSYSVQDKQLLMEKAKKQILETAAIGLPQVSASVGYTWNAQLAQTPLPDGFANRDTAGNPILDGNPDLVAFGVEHQTTAAIELNQLIFDASYIVALRATRVVKDIANLDVEKANIDIEADIAKAYYAVLVANEQVKIAAENVSTQQQNLNEARELFKNGFNEEQDVQQLELLLGNQRTFLNNAQRLTTLSVQALQLYMGMDIGQEIVLSDDLDGIIDKNTGEEAAQIKLFDHEAHIDFRKVMAQQRAANLQLNNQRNTFYPRLSGFVRHTESNFGDDGFNAFNFSDNWIPGTALGLNLQWDIFQGMGRSARIQQAKIDLDRAKVAEELTKNNLKLAHNQSKSNHAYSMDNYKTQKRNMELSKSIRNKTRTKYSEGISSSLELTQAENQYLQSQANYLQSVTDLLNAKVELERSLGK